MNKIEEAQKIDSLFEVESGLDTAFLSWQGIPLSKTL